MSKSVKQILDEARPQEIAFAAIQCLVTDAHHMAYRAALTAAEVFGERKLRGSDKSQMTLDIVARKSGIGSGDYIPAFVRLHNWTFEVEDARKIAAQILEACDLLEGSA